jgi:NAD+ kinase
MRTVSLTTNFNIPEKASVAVEVASRLLACGVSVCVPAYAASTESVKLPDGDVRALPADELYAAADMIAVIGGDGSILEAARRASERGTPILGINKGRLGYMTELEVSELDRIPGIVAGGFRLERRAMLRVELVSSGSVRYTCFALNDAVLTNGSVSRLVDLQVLAGGEPVGSYRADGIIVCTPTGSTAYSLAAGGPVIEPSLRCICVTPICAHSPAARPTVFTGDAVIEVKNICVREPCIMLSVDGRVNVRVEKYDSVRVTMSERTANLVRVKPGRFYSDLCKKLESI